MTNSTEPTWKLYQLPSNSPELFLGRAKRVWYDRYPCGPLPGSFSWLPRVGIHGRFAADSCVLSKYSSQTWGWDIWLELAYDRSPLTRCTTGLNDSIDAAVATALSDALEKAVSPHAMSPTLVKRNGTRPSGAVRNALDNWVSPSLTIWYT